jgi:XTP/dITP diphosphohydrolase
LQAMLAPSGRGAGAPGRSGHIPRRRSPTAPLSRTPWPRRATPPAHSGLPALADDAGLCVDAFGGLPGVDTAYYATQFGYEKGDDNNVRALLEQMQGIANRRAAMVSTLVACAVPTTPSR